MKKKSIASFAVGIVGVLVVFLVNVTVVWAAVPHDYDSCISSSGGRGSISSVKWACENTHWNTAGNNVCSLWIGGSNSTSTTIEVDEASGDATIYVYGMCTRAGAPVMDVETKNDNGSIGKINPFWRGNWGSPTYSPVKLNISKFIQGLTSSTTSGGDQYSRTVNLKRCYAYRGDDGSYWRYGNDDDECSDQNVSITLVVRNRFAGKASVSSGSTNKTTGFVSANKTADDLNIDCSSGECTAKFVLDLKSLIGNGSTSYTIYRNDIAKKTSSSTPGSSGSKVGEYPETMHPGDRICYSIQFNVTAASGEKATAKACAVATASLTSNLDIKIRDESSSVGYRNWRSDYVYAKPNDAVDLVGTYTPAAQNAYGWKTTSTRITNDNSVYANNNRTVGKTFDANRTIKWDNAFTIYINDSFYENFSGNIGDGNLYSNDDSPYSYAVNNGDVGKSIDAKARTNYDMNARRKVAPASVLIVNENGNSVANVDISEKTSGEVRINVPYNFSNSVNITTEDTEIRAGGGKDIEYNLYVGEKQNDETNGFYATKVKNAHWKASVKYSDAGYVEFASGSGDLEPGDNAQHGRVSLPEDLAAGTNVCVRVELSPAYSGGDKNLDPNAFSGVAVTEKCFVVAKKPSFQVWGGSVYSSGNINLGDYVVKSGGSGYVGNYMFGSWTELGLLANGDVKGFASGAGLGYTKDSNGNLFPNPFGNNTGAGSASSPGGVAAGSDLCVINTLSFKNEGCRSSNIGNANISVDDDRSILVDNLEEWSDESVTAEGLELNCDGGGCVLNGGILRSGVKVIVERGNNLKINGNIEYGVSSGDNMPKLFIYAENITIDCWVTRVDAVLIAEGYINTCVNDDYNSRANSNQLKINGSIIADKLILNRTYGAGVGEYSIVPAEIINYDSTLYVWGGENSDRINKGRYISEYTREMSPRY